MAYKRDPNSIIYTSSYDRGLEHLLKMWPDIRREVPQAKLQVFYGWQLFERFHKDNPASMMWMKDMQKKLTQEGIIDHGRLSQRDLVKEYQKCSIFAYPTHFGEINCISAIKAQLYGCEPVVVNYAALKETVKYGRKVDGDIYDEETQDKYKEQLIDALKNPMNDQKREEMMAWAKDNYGWDKIATSWSKEFRG